jgi:TRAP-type C4-dicarboxylate transport system permease small subunit
MKRILKIVYGMDLSLQVVAGLGLAFMMVITIVDITMRLVGKPIIGAIELICFCGAIVVGFSLPYSSWMKAHVYVDFLEQKLSPRARLIMTAVTRLIGILLFLFISYNFILYGISLKQTGEVSPGLKLPFYPITFGLAVSCFMESLTLLTDLLKLFSEEQPHE